MSQEVGPEGSNSPATSSCMFYKLVVASTLQDQKLRIPEKFVKLYGNELCSVATLTVPNGHMWLVELQKVDKKWWFNKGWHEFVEHYSIRAGHFLVFIYEGKLNFTVHIYDLTEIKYPSDTVRLDRLKGPIRADTQCLLPYKNDDVLRQIFGSTSSTFDESNFCDWPKSNTSAASTENIHLRKDVCRFGEKLPSSQEIVIQFDRSELASTTEKVGVHSGRMTTGKRRIETNVYNQVPRAEVISASMKIASGKITRRARAVTAEEKKRAIRAADAFKPANPFFRVVLRPSYVYKGLLLHIPISFSQQYFNSFREFITLRLSDGKEWPVRCICNNGRAKLSKGWTEFVWENNLEEGDVCVFELLNTRGIVLKVFIFRALQDEAATAPNVKSEW